MLQIKQPGGFPTTAPAASLPGSIARKLSIDQKASRVPVVGVNQYRFAQSVDQDAGFVVPLEDATSQVQ
jgi:hypothetical protein